MSSTLPKILVILGPTATGKSDMAVACALFLKKQGIKAEVISADSRQIYTGLNIGAGKITKKEMKGVPHHGLDIVSPTRRKMFSVAEFQKYADSKISEIIARGAVPILCGGTGFYIDAVVDGVILPEVLPNKELREKLAHKTPAQLFAMLTKLDKKRAAEIDKQNPVRLIRAIEIAKALGKVPRVQVVQKYDSLLIGLDMEKEKLCQKVHTRALKRLKIGMVAEAVQLHKNGVSWKRMRQLGLEYGLLAQLLQGDLTKKQFIERLLIETWKYAKRQKTWFRRELEWRKNETHWFDPTKKNTLTKLLNLVKNFLKK